MARMKPAWYYTRQAAEATARANYYATKAPPVDGTTVNSRGASTRLIYHSLILRNGTDPSPFYVNVLNANLALITATEAGLATTPASGESPLPIRGTGVKPSKISWYRGDATPVRKRTAWNSSYTKYYDSTGGRSHYSMPFSDTTGTFDADDLRTKFDALFGASGTKRAQLGTANGRAQLTLEYVPISANS